MSKRPKVIVGGNQGGLLRRSCALHHGVGATHRVAIPVPDDNVILLKMLCPTCAQTVLNKEPGARVAIGRR